MPSTMLGRVPVLAMALGVLAAAASAQTIHVTTGLGGAPANGINGTGVLSGDGRFVVFASDASNLVAGDTNGSTDVFVRDLAGAVTTRVSLAAEEGLERTGASGDLSEFVFRQFDVSDDGRFVVFASRAALTATDTLMCAPQGVPVNCPDVYLRDRQTDATLRLSLGLGGAPPDGASARPRISGDGNWIVFESTASNLVAGDTNGVADVFLLNRQTLATTRVSVATDGMQANLASALPAINDDGTVIAFVSASALLSAEPDTVACMQGPPACQRPFMVDRTAGTTRRVPMPSIQTTRVIDTGFGPLTITYRVNARSVAVAPDGASVAVTVVSRASIITNTTGFTAIGWICERAGGSIRFRRDDAEFADWNGALVTYGEYPMGEVITGHIGLLDLDATHSEVVSDVSSIALAFIGNASENGRFVVYQRTAGSTPGAPADLYVIDRDPDADGLPSLWETRFGFDPAVASAADDPDADGLTNLAEFRRGSHPVGHHVRYHAEGATNAFFGTNFTLGNPGTTAATVVLRFLGDDGRASWTTVHIPPREQRAVPRGDETGSFAAVVESDQPIVSERLMIWGQAGADLGYGAHAETSIAAPSTTWFLAEGATHGAFQLFYLLQNPGAAPAQVTITYLRPAPEAPLAVPYTVAPESRLTIAVGAIPALAATDVSASIVSDTPILVERAMYMNTTDPPRVFGAGHAGAGVTAAQARWFLAEGATGSFFDLYYLIANPAPQAARVRVSYLLPAGAPVVKEYQVPAASRVTISVDGEDPRLVDTPVSAIVESLDGTGIVVERSMWWPGQGRWQEAHLAAGSTSTSRRWALAAGGVNASIGLETYVLIANTSGVAGTATITTLPAFTGGPSVTTTIPLAANSRVSVPMSQYPALSSLFGSQFGVLVESDGPEIVVEYAKYWNADGIVWAAGTAALATPLP